MAYLLVAMIILTPLAGRPQSGPVLKDQPKNEKIPCYAFLRRGDLWTVCGSKREKVHLNSRVSTFAISADGLHLAFLSAKHPSSKAGPHSTLFIVSLQPSFRTTERQTDFFQLYASCGSILAYEPGNWNATDIFSNKRLDSLPVRSARCSSDGHVNAGWTKYDVQGESDLLVEVNGKAERSLSVFLSRGTDFDVSSSGKYVAYFRDSPGQHGYIQLCVLQIGASESCSSVVNSGDWSDLGSPFVSVSDSGEVIYLSNFGTGCPNQVCTGVSFWHPGLSEPVVLEKSDAEVVQSITPQVAASLHEWALTFSSSSSATRKR